MRFQMKVGAAAVVLAGAVITVLACTTRAEPTSPPAQASHIHVAARRGGPPSADLEQKLAELRRATVRYHDFDAAQADGYSVQVTGCMEDASLGGMGYHYAKASLIDGAVIEARPEVLLYEPRGKGRLRLVGVEFIIPFTAWAGSEAPTLYGETFARNETFQVWALHVWAWRDNRKGVFADWNGRVSCDRDDA